MGYVFTPREFEEGRIPTKRDYSTAMKLLRYRLATFYHEGLIHGANLHGSNFHTDGGVGSDIDVLILMNSQPSEDPLSRLHEEIKSSTYVPVDFVPVQLQLAQRGYHQLDYFYWLYMKTFCQEGIIGNNPIPVIKPGEDWNNPTKGVRDRLEAQLVKLTKQRVNLPTDYNEEHMDFLEKIMRQPIYAAIDLLRLKHGNYPAINGRPLSKAECCQLFIQEFPELVTPDLSTVMETRTRYRQFLLDENTTVSDYVELLREISSIYPSAKKVIEQTFEFLVDKL